jgi:hypothetical protein
MCCFSLEVDLVTDTKIFARDSTSPLQFLVYEMTFSAAEDLAMILPIPVPPQTPEKVVRFINLEKYPDFFKALESGFPKPPPSRGSFGGAGGLGLGGAKLDVVDVGSFEASFVPTIGDFSRLDERFRLPAGTWEKLPQYKTFGFAVFKLKKENSKVHPMAFEFPRANPKQLFFPTVHIHDGKVHEKADFDHTLYAQFSAGHHFGFQLWKESPQPAGMFMNIAKCEGVVDKNAHAYKRVIQGTRKNDDIVA